MEKVNEAISDLNRALELNPDDADSFYLRGLSFYQLSDDTPAAADFEKACELNPADADAFYMLGLIRYYGERDLDSAIFCYTRSIDLKLDKAEAYLYY